MQDYWNCVYNVKSPYSSIDCVLRVGLPVDPWYKVESEVSTMFYISQNTTIPIPRVFAFCPTMDNPIRFEWIVMEKMPGVPFSAICGSNTLSREQEKGDLLQVAEWIHQIESLRFDEIGSIFCDWEKGTFEVKKVVDPFFMYEGRVREDFTRDRIMICRSF